MRACHAEKRPARRRCRGCPASRHRWSKSAARSRRRHLGSPGPSSAAGPDRQRSSPAGSLRHRQTTGTVGHAPPTRFHRASSASLPECAVPGRAWACRMSAPYDPSRFRIAGPSSRPKNPIPFRPHRPAPGKVPPPMGPEASRKPLQQHPPDTRQTSVHALEKKTVPHHHPTTAQEACRRPHPDSPHRCRTAHGILHTRCRRHPRQPAGPSLPRMHAFPSPSGTAHRHPTFGKDAVRLARRPISNDTRTPGTTTSPCTPPGTTRHDPPDPVPAAKECPAHAPQADATARPSHPENSTCRTSSTSSSPSSRAANSTG
jgi:hypothetical protein